MENFSRFGHLLIISTLLLLAEVLSSTTVEATGNHHHQWGWTAVKPACQGSIADCMADSEFEMDSESNRRILATTNYISYRALQRNTVPCSQRGASYYNCKPGAKANPSTRGCSTITRCRSS